MLPTLSPLKKGLKFKKSHVFKRKKKKIALRVLPPLCADRTQAKIFSWIRPYMCVGACMRMHILGRKGLPLSNISLIQAIYRVTSTSRTHLYRLNHSPNILVTHHFDHGNTCIFR